MSVGFHNISEEIPYQHDNDQTDRDSTTGDQEAEQVRADFHDTEYAQHRDYVPEHLHTLDSSIEQWYADSSALVNNVDEQGDAQIVPPVLDEMKGEENYSPDSDDGAGQARTQGHSHGSANDHDEVTQRPADWKHAGKIVMQAFLPRKVLQRKAAESPASLDLRFMSHMMSGFNSISLANVWSKINPSRFLAKPLASYHLVVIISAVLTIFGLLMVQSASAVKGITSHGSAYGLFTSQVIFVSVGVFLFIVALHLSVNFLRYTAFLGLVFTTLALVLVLVPGIGVEVNSSRRWFNIMGLSLQPSELVKVALCIWGAHLLATRRQDQASYKELLLPLLPVSALISILIILEPNLSTMIIIVIIASSLLWFVGLPLRIFGALGAVAIMLFGVLAVSAGYRAQRVMSFLGLTDADSGANYQSLQARYALAGGGLWGQGLGQSKSKWNYLPNEHNDFIFAVVGEELGFLGAALLVLLFVALTFVGLRIALRSADPFLRLLAGSISALISGQALINIGYVVGVLPVTGVQLPLISAGGTAATTNLFLLGILASVARHEPEAIAAIVSQHKHHRRLYSLPVPKPYVPRTAVEKRRNKVYARNEMPWSYPRGKHAAYSGKKDPIAYEDNYPFDKRLDEKSLYNVYSPVRADTSLSHRTFTQARQLDRELSEYSRYGMYEDYGNYSQEPMSNYRYSSIMRERTPYPEQYDPYDSGLFPHQRNQGNWQRDIPDVKRYHTDHRFPADGKQISLAASSHYPPERPGYVKSVPRRDKPPYGHAPERYQYRNEHDELESYDSYDSMHRSYITDARARDMSNFLSSPPSFSSVAYTPSTFSRISSIRRPEVSSLLPSSHDTARAKRKKN